MTWSPCGNPVSARYTISMKFEKRMTPMRNNVTRRQLLQTVSAASLMPAFLAGADASWPPPTGDKTPRICLGRPSAVEEKELRHYKQAGVDYMIMGGPPSPWTPEALSAIMDKYKAGGIQVINMMLGG